jgi:hypothetical protein
MRAAGSNTKNGKTSYGGILTKDNAGNGVYKLELRTKLFLFKIKILLIIRLGVVVTEDINTITSNKLRTPTASSQVPSFSYELWELSIRSKSTVPEDKRLKLEIYYTKPN